LIAQRSFMNQLVSEQGGNVSQNDVIRQSAMEINAIQRTYSTSILLYKQCVKLFADLLGNVAQCVH